MILTRRCCAPAPRRERALTVPGAGAQGVHTAVEFLTGVTKGLLEGGPPPISAKGLPVVVVGGGDTGADCVATCIRQGAKSVAQFEIVAAPPPKRAPGNPWPLWPKVLKPNYAREEAVPFTAGISAGMKRRCRRFIPKTDGLPA